MELWAGTEEDCVSGADEWVRVVWVFRVEEEVVIGMGKWLRAAWVEGCGGADRRIEIVWIEGDIVAVDGSSAWEESDALLPEFSALN